MCTSCVQSRQPHAWRVASQNEMCANCLTIRRFSQFYCSLCYIQLCAHIQNCWLTSIVHSVVMSRYCLLLKPYLKNLCGDDDKHNNFLISPISNYCYDLTKILSPERVLTQLVSAFKVPDILSHPRNYNSYPFLQNRLCDVSLTYYRFISEVTQLALQMCVIFGSTYFC